MPPSAGILQTQRAIDTQAIRGRSVLDFSKDDGQVRPYRVSCCKYALCSLGRRTDLLRATQKRNNAPGECLTTPSNTLRTT